MCEFDAEDMMLTLRQVQRRPAGRWRDYKLPKEARGAGTEVAGTEGVETPHAEALERKRTRPHG